MARGSDAVGTVRVLSFHFHSIFIMSNALLAMSGPAFGNMDVTVYDVYTVTSTTAVTSQTNAATIFSERSWSWTLVDIMVGGYMLPRPFAVSNTVSISGTFFTLGTTTSSTGWKAYLYGSSTSLKGGMNADTWTITAYVPST